MRERERIEDGMEKGKRRWGIWEGEGISKMGGRSEEDGMEKGKRRWEGDGEKKMGSRGNEDVRE